MLCIENKGIRSTSPCESSKIKKLPEFEISDDNYVKVTRMGNVTEVMYMERVNHKATIQKLDKTHFLVISTGEIIEVQENESRALSKNSLYQTFRRLRGIINANVIDPNYARWITLTYAENMTDTVKLYKDFEKFIKRMRTYCEKNCIEPFEYIVAMEPQNRGAWHCHLLMIWKSKAPYIPSNDLWQIWSPQGFTQNRDFVKIKKLDDIDNIGAYLTAYLGDMEVTEALQNNSNNKLGQCKIVETEKEKKAYIKGARLSLYPSGFNLYRTSRGIKQPTEFYMSYSEFKKESAGTLTFKTAIAISDDDYNNTICKEYYNSKRH